MDGQGVNYDGNACLGSHIAQSLDQYKIDDGLVITQPSVDGDVHIVGLHGYLRRHRTMERRDYLGWLKLITKLSKSLEYPSNL